MRRIQLGVFSVVVSVMTIWCSVSPNSMVLSVPVIIHHHPAHLGTHLMQSHSFSFDPRSYHRPTQCFGNSQWLGMASEPLTDEGKVPHWAWTLPVMATDLSVTPTPAHRYRHDLEHLKLGCRSLRPKKERKLDDRHPSCWRCGKINFKTNHVRSWEHKS